MTEATTPEQIQGRIRYFESAVAEYEAAGDAYMTDWARERVRFYRAKLADKCGGEITVTTVAARKSSGSHT
jgi:hypothetical protein